MEDGTTTAADPKYGKSEHVRLYLKGADNRQCELHRMRSDRELTELAIDHRGWHIVVHPPEPRSVPVLLRVLVDARTRRVDRLPLCLRHVLVS